VDDVDKVKKYKWHRRKGANTNYCASTINGDKLFLHRLILDYDGDDDVDHINHNGLDNRKSNLRIVSHSLNIMNQHNESNGVMKTSSGKYRAAIMVNKKSKWLGVFDTFQEAKKVRVDYEKQLFATNSTQ